MGKVIEGSGWRNYEIIKRLIGFSSFSQIFNPIRSRKRITNSEHANNLINFCALFSHLYCSFKAFIIK
jgi:hypothetical protein